MKLIFINFVSVLLKKRYFSYLVRVEVFWFVVFYFYCLYVNGKERWGRVCILKISDFC